MTEVDHEGGESSKTVEVGCAPDGLGRPARSSKECGTKKLQEPFGPCRDIGRRADLFATVLYVTTGCLQRRLAYPGGQVEIRLVLLPVTIVENAFASGRHRSDCVCCVLSNRDLVHKVARSRDYCIRMKDPRERQSIADAT